MLTPEMTPSQGLLCVSIVIFAVSKTHLGGRRRAAD